MWYIVSALIITVAAIIAGRSLWGDWSSTPIVLLVCGLVFGLPSIPMIAATGGLTPDYGHGHRDGYITKISTKGVYWKTVEAEVQVGTGEMAALQSPWRVSIPDPKVADLAERLTGKKVRVHYTEWLIQPFSRGESGYEAQGITPIEELP